MGESKRNREAVKARALQEADLWLAPFTEKERLEVERIAAMPFSTIPRAEPDVIAYMRMRPQQCNKNCLDYVKLDPDGRSKMVSGWVRLGGTYVAHSVVERDGRRMCITPDPFGRKTLEFAADPTIQWVTEGDYYVPASDFMARVRIEPEKVMAHAQRIKDALLAGMNPYKAMQLPDE